METLYNIIEDKVEALEFNIRETSQVTGIPLAKLRTRKGVLVAAIVRRGQLILPDGSSTIEKGDSVVIITTEKGLSEITDILEEL